MYLMEVSVVSVSQACKCLPLDVPDHSLSRLLHPPVHLLHMFSKVRHICHPKDR